MSLSNQLPKAPSSMGDRKTATPLIVRPHVSPFGSAINMLHPIGQLSLQAPPTEICPSLEVSRTSKHSILVFIEVPNAVLRIYNPRVFPVSLHQPNGVTLIRDNASFIAGISEPYSLFQQQVSRKSGSSFSGKEGVRSKPISKSSPFNASAPIVVQVDKDANRCGMLLHIESNIYIESNANLQLVLGHKSIFPTSIEEYPCSRALAGRDQQIQYLLSVLIPPWFPTLAMKRALYVMFGQLLQASVLQLYIDSCHVVISHSNVPGVPCTALLICMGAPEECYTILSALPLSFDLTTDGNLLLLHPLSLYPARAPSQLFGRENLVDWAEAVFPLQNEAPAAFQEKQVLKFLSFLNIELGDCIFVMAQVLSNEESRFLTISFGFHSYISDGGMFIHACLVDGTAPSLTFSFPIKPAQGEAQAYYHGMLLKRSNLSLYLKPCSASRSPFTIKVGLREQSFSSDQIDMILSNSPPRLPETLSSLHIGFVLHIFDTYLASPNQSTQQYFTPQRDDPEARVGVDPPTWILDFVAQCSSGDSFKNICDQVSPSLNMEISTSEPCPVLSCAPPEFLPEYQEYISSLQDSFILQQASHSAAEASQLCEIHSLTSQIEQSQYEIGNLLKELTNLSGVRDTLAAQVVLLTKNFDEISAYVAAHQCNQGGILTVSEILLRGTKRPCAGGEAPEEVSETEAGMDTEATVVTAEGILFFSSLIMLTLRQITLPPKKARVNRGLNDFSGQRHKIPFAVVTCLVILFYLLNTFRNTIYVGHTYLLSFIRTCSQSLVITLNTIRYSSRIPFYSGALQLQYPHPRCVDLLAPPYVVHVTGVVSCTLLAQKGARVLALIESLHIPFPCFWLLNGKPVSPNAVIEGSSALVGNARLLGGSKASDDKVACWQRFKRYQNPEASRTTAVRLYDPRNEVSKERPQNDNPRITGINSAENGLCRLVRGSRRLPSLLSPNPVRATYRDVLASGTLSPPRASPIGVGLIADDSTGATPLITIPYFASGYQSAKFIPSLGISGGEPSTASNSPLRVPTMLHPDKPCSSCSKELPSPTDIRARLNRIPFISAQKTLYGGVQITIVTWNSNGLVLGTAYKEHMWAYLARINATIFIVVDHRGTERQLSFWKEDIACLTRKDVTMHVSPVVNSASSLHSHSVGGTAIFVIGPFSAMARSTPVRDPSGGGSFMGIRLDFGPSKPCILIYAVYLMIRSTTGIHTLFNRTKKYLTFAGKTTDPRKWQLRTFASQVRSNVARFPDSVHVIAGDFNHHKWDEENTVTNTFTGLGFNNVPHARDNGETRSFTYRAPQSVKWLDHVLTRGPVNLISHFTPNGKLEGAVSDHCPLEAVYELPPDYFIDTPANTYRQADLKARALDIRPHKEEEVLRFQEECTKLLSIVIPSESDILQLNNFLTEMTEGIVHAAHTVRALQHPPRRFYEGFSPEAQFCHSYRHTLTLCIRACKMQQCLKAHNLLDTFFDKFWGEWNPRHGFRYRALMGEYLSLQEWPVSVSCKGIISKCLISSLAALLPFLLKEKRRMVAVTSKAITLQMRQKVSKYTAMQIGGEERTRLRRQINAILEKPPRKGLGPIVDKNNVLHANPGRGHIAATKHFSDHFSEKPLWLDRVHANDNSNEGYAFRQSLLQGSWRDTYFQAIMEGLDTQAQVDVARYLDCCQIKASATTQAEFQRVTDLPFSYSDFKALIMSKKGGTAPGPSGLTINMLKLCGDEVLQRVWLPLEALWRLRSVPTQWLTGSMVLIAKDADSVTLSEHRPITLLEVLRKCFLSLVAGRYDPIIHSNGLLNPIQKGGIARSGCEDAVLIAVNCIEEAHERRIPLHMVAFDKAKAFDSPPKLLGVALPWQRIGIPEDVALYFVNCDRAVNMTVKTAHSVTHKLSAHFHMQRGVCQGDTLSCRSYNLVEDITLDFLTMCLPDLVPFRIKDAQGILYDQPPSQIIDDNHIYCSSQQGATRAIELMMIPGIVMGIELNVSKTKYTCIEWTDGGEISTNSSPLTPMSPRGTTINVHPLGVHANTRFLGAYLNAVNAPDAPLEMLGDQVNNITAILSRKKSFPCAISNVLYSSVFPRLGYIAKFTNATSANLHKLAGPLRAVIKKKYHITLRADATVFGYQGPAIVEQHRDLGDYINDAKYGVLLRMQDGNVWSQRTIQALIQRTIRNVGTPLHHLSSQGIPCNPVSAAPCHRTQSWGESLIDYLQEGGLNVFSTSHIPTPCEGMSQTFLLDLWTMECGISFDELADFLQQSQVIFLEELYDSDIQLMSPDQQEERLKGLSNFLPSNISVFIQAQWRWGLHQQHITHGKYKLRSGHMFHVSDRQENATHLPHVQDGDNTRELFLPEALDDNEVSWATRDWVTTTINSIHYKGYNVASSTALDHSNDRTSYTWPDTGYQLRRMLSGVRVREPASQCKSGEAEDSAHVFSLQQWILPNEKIRKSLNVNVLPRFVFPTDVLSAWNSGVRSSPVYTDGSAISPPIATHLCDPLPPSKIASVIVFASQATAHLSTRHQVLTAWRLKGRAIAFNSYDAEVIASAAAANLPKKSDIIQIITDCKGLQTAFHAHTNDFFHTELYSEQMHANSIGMPRDGSDMGLLMTGLIAQFQKVAIRWQQAHVERRKNHTRDLTPDEAGNQIADYIARGMDREARQLCPGLIIHETPLHEAIALTSVRPLIVIASSTRQSFQGTKLALAKAVVIHRLNSYILKRSQARVTHLTNWEFMNHSLLHHIYTRATTLNSHKSSPPNSNPIVHRAFTRILWDKFNNLACGWKIQNSSQLKKEEILRLEDPDLISLVPLIPRCPCPHCVALDIQDSLSHTFCKCTLPSILHQRNLAFATLQECALSNTHAPTATFQHYFLEWLQSVCVDSRAWACCIPMDLLQEWTCNSQCSTLEVIIALASLLPHLLSAATAMWKAYVLHTHLIEDEEYREVEQEVAAAPLLLHHNIITAQLKLKRMPGPAPILRSKKPPAHPRLARALKVFKSTAPRVISGRAIARATTHYQTKKELSRGQLKISDMFIRLAKPKPDQTDPAPAQPAGTIVQNRPKPDPPCAINGKCPDLARKSPSLHTSEQLKECFTIAHPKVASTLGTSHPQPLTMSVEPGSGAPRFPPPLWKARSCPWDWPRKTAKRGHIVPTKLPPSNRYRYLVVDDSDSEDNQCGKETPSHQLPEPSAVGTSQQKKRRKTHGEVSACDKLRSIVHMPNIPNSTLGITALLAAMGLTAVDVAGDGSCQFHALAHSFLHSTGEVVQASLLRREAANSLINQELGDLINSAYSTTDSYTDLLANGWGSAASLIAIALLHGPIRVLTPQSYNNTSYVSYSHYEKPPANPHSIVTFILYIDSNHYQALVPAGANHTDMNAPLHKPTFTSGSNSASRDPTRKRRTDDHVVTSQMQKRVRAEEVILHHPP